VTPVRAIGRLDDSDGGPLGTWFAVGGNCAGEPHWGVTAFHCVGDRDADPPVIRHRQVRLAGRSEVLAATVSDYDAWLDIALLELSSPLPPGLDPVALGGEVMVGRDFEAFGFPQAAEDAELVGWPVGGKVTSVLMRLRNGAPVLAVHVDGLDHQLPLQGISGAPVLVGETTQRAVAVLRYTVVADSRTGVALGNTLFATPVAAIAERFPQLRRWVEVPERERERRDSLANLLSTGLGPDGLLPSLATVSPDALEIPRSVPVMNGATDRYIERADDARIRMALEESRFVIVTGEAKAGKSRSAFEVVRALYPDASLVAPCQGNQQLAEIVEKDLLRSDPGRLVIWLDGITAFLQPTEGVTRRLIDQLLERYPQALIVGTATGAALSRLRANDLNRPALAVLRAATEVRLRSVPTEAELAREGALSRRGLPR